MKSLSDGVILGLEFPGLPETCPSLLMSNPNRNANRVPTAQEAETLKNLVSLTSKVLKQHEIEEHNAQMALNEINQRYDRQKALLDSTESEKCSTQEIINTISKQKPALQAKLTKIRGLLHPIKRLPLEIVGFILEMAMEHHIKAPKPTKPTKTRESNQLSQVCRLWREAALQNPWLWDEIVVPMNCPPEEIRERLESSAARAARTPVTIRLVEIGTNLHTVDGPQWDKAVDDAFRQCNFRKFPTISILELVTGSKVPVTTALSHMMHFPEGKLDLLEIRRKGSMPKASDPHDDMTWDLTVFMHRFPPFRALAMENIPWYNIQPQLILPSVQDLNVARTQHFPILDFLHIFPNLAKLRFGGRDPIYDSTTDSLSHNKLESLSLRARHNEGLAEVPWDDIDCPNLKNIKLLDTSKIAAGVTLEAAQLITRSKHLLSVDVDTGPLTGDFLRLVNLTVTGFKVRFPEYGCPSYLLLVENIGTMFPNLARLHFVFDDSDTKLDAADFTTIVTQRFLPVTHPNSTLYSGLNIIHTLVISEKGTTLGGWTLSAMAKLVPKIQTDTLATGYRVSTMSWAELL